MPRAKAFAAVASGRNSVCGDVLADVLGDLRVEVAIERLFAAPEAAAVMRVEHLQPERCPHFVVRPKSSRCRFAARRSAGVGAGGFRMAFATRCWSSSESLTTSASSSARHAASCAAATTKSVSVRPYISAARLSSPWTFEGSRASRRAIGAE